MLYICSMYILSVASVSVIQSIAAQMFGSFYKLKQRIYYIATTNLTTFAKAVSLISLSMFIRIINQKLPRWRHHMKTSSPPPPPPPPHTHTHTHTHTHKHTNTCHQSGCFDMPQCSAYVYCIHIYLILPHTINHDVIRYRRHESRNANTSIFVFLLHF